MKSPRVLVTTITALLASLPAQAANYTWDTVAGDGAAVTPGDGIWDLSGSNLFWNNAGTNVAWTNANTAIFGGADGTYAVTLGANVSTAGLTFNNSGYTISAASPFTIANSTSAVTVASGKTATIGTNVTLSRTGAYNFLGGGRLIVSGTMTNTTGASEIKDGSTLEIAAGGNVTFNGSPVIGANTAATISQNGNLLVSGGNLTMAGSATNFVIGNLKSGTTNSVVTISSGTMSIANNSLDGIRFGSNTPDGSGWTVNGTFNLDGGVVTIPGVRRYVPTGTGVINATFNFNGGILRANNTKPSSASSTVFFDAGINAMVKAGGAKIDSNGFDLFLPANLLDGGGGGGFEKLGTGILTLTGANTYTGTTTISDGGLQIGAGGTVGTLGTGAIVNNGALTINRSNAFNLSNGISGNGSVTLTGGGTYTFGGANTYSGATNISSATRVDLTGTFASNISVAGGGNVGGEGSTSGSLTFGGTHALFFDPGTAAHLTANSINASAATITLTPTTGVGGVGILVLEAAGGITGAVGSNFLFTGRGTAYLNGTSTQLLFDSTPGVLKWVGSNGTNPTFWDVQTTTNWDNAGTPDKFFTGDAVTFDDTATNYDVAIQGASVTPGSITFNNSLVDYIVTGGEIAGAGGVAKNGTGLVVIANNNSYAGGTTINAGTIQLGGGLNAGGTLGTGAVTNNAAIVTNFGANAATVANDITGPGTLTQSGTGTVSLTGTNSYSGATIINAGTLQIGAGGTAGTLGTAAVVNNATLAFNRSDEITVTNVITGTGGVTKLGNGVLILGSSNTYSGPTTISGGVLRVTASSGVLGDTTNGTAVTNTGAALQLQGGVTVTDEALSLVGDGVNGSTAPGALRNLSGNNEWAGDITIGAAATTRIVSDSGTLKVSGDVALSPTASDQFVLQGNGNGEVSGIVSGVSRVTRSVSGTGTWTLTGANTYTGKTTISGGFLRVSSINSVVGGAASSNLGAPATAASGTIDFGNGATTGGLVYTGAGETTDRIMNLAATGTGGAILDQSGNGLLKFTSDLSVTGPSGTKALVLQGSTAGTGEFAGIISNGTAGSIVGVTKAGAGTWALSSANSYTGVTNVNAGKLALAATGSISGSTSINVSGGATFDVSALAAFTLGSTQSLTGGVGTNAGVVVGTLLTEPGAIISPGIGAGNRGTLSVSNGFALLPDAHLALDLAGATAGTEYDQFVIAGGNISLAGDLAGSTLTFTPNISDVFYIILNNGVGTTTGTLAGVVEGGSLFIGAQEFQISYTSDFGGAGFVVGGSGNDVALMAIPEPGSAAVLLAGLGVLVGQRRRKHQPIVG